MEGGKPFVMAPFSFYLAEQKYSTVMEYFFNEPFLT